MFFLFFEAWSLGDTSKLEGASPIRVLGWWLVLQFRAISTLPPSGREKRYLLSKLQRVWGIKLNSTDKGSKVEQNSKNQNETVSDQVNIFFLIWARSHINTTMGWIWETFYKMWVMGVPLTADRLSEESQISWKKLFHLSVLEQTLFSPVLIIVNWWTHREFSQRLVKYQSWKK